MAFTQPVLKAIRDLYRDSPTLEEAHETMCNMIERIRNAMKGPKDPRGELYEKVIAILHRRWCKLKSPLHMECMVGIINDMKIVLVGSQLYMMQS